MNALVLSGGGARGAYEAGVLAYLYEDLPKQHGFCPRFDIVCGSSVGAINAAFFASSAHDPEFMIRNLLSAWEMLTPDQVIQFSFKKIATLPLWGFRGTSPEKSALFEVTPLLHLLKTRISWTQLARNITRGPLHALTISATDLETGVTVIFVHKKKEGALPPFRDPYVTAIPSLIAPKHILASAALPLLFPPVQLKRRLYYDGSLRQSTPLSPALRLGASRIFLISLRSTTVTQKYHPDADASQINPNFLYMAGKLFNAFMLDRLAYDLDRLDRFNAMFEMGEKAFGPTFLETLNQAVTPRRGAPYQKVKRCVITPSADLGAIAAKIVQEGEYKKRHRKVTEKILHGLSRLGFIKSSDILSYIFFDAAYTRSLIELGRKDASKKEQEILAFFEGPSPFRC